MNHAAGAGDPRPVGLQHPFWLAAGTAGEFDRLGKRWRESLSSPPLAPMPDDEIVDARGVGVRTVFVSSADQDGCRTGIEFVETRLVGDQQRWPGGRNLGAEVARSVQGLQRHPDLVRCHHGKQCDQVLDVVVGADSDTALRLRIHGLQGNRERVCPCHQLPIVQGNSRCLDGNGIRVARGGAVDEIDGLHARPDPVSRPCPAPRRMARPLRRVPICNACSVCAALRRYGRPDPPSVR